MFRLATHTYNECYSELTAYAALAYSYLASFHNVYQGHAHQ